MFDKTAGLRVFFEREEQRTKYRILLAWVKLKVEFVEEC